MVNAGKPGYLSYGEALRPVRPGRSPRRTPVIKLGGTGTQYSVPGPGAYTPHSVSNASAWIMGDLKARKSFVEVAGESPGPVYQMRASVERQAVSTKASSPRFGFGTQPRIIGATDVATGPGPGSYSPRVTNRASPYATQTVAAGQLTELTTPRGSVQITEGTWSRTGDRSLATVRNYPMPSAVTYTPRFGCTTVNQPGKTMGAVGKRAGIGGAGDPAAPGPLAYHPAAKSRFGGGAIGDSPSYTMADKNDSIPMYVSKENSRIYQGKHSPSPAAYTPLEEFGVTSYTISNTSRHAPMVTFGSEPRPCAP